MSRITIAPANPDDPEVAELLYAAIGGDRARLTAAVNRYATDPATTLIAARSTALLGVAGYELHRDHLTLLHLATAESHRHRGIGRRLLAKIRAHHPDSSIVAETDITALGFYLATGFGATSLGEKYPGVERFAVRSGSG